MSNQTLIKATMVMEAIQDSEIFLINEFINHW